jgi:phosphoglycolate phosphatase
MIAFDLDGTLVDSRLDLLNSVNALRASVGYPPLRYESSWQDLCKGMPHLYATCFPKQMQDEPGLAHDFEAIYLEQIFKTTTVYDGLALVIPELAKQASLAVVTNKPQRATERLLEAAGLISYFDVIVGGDRCEKPKPSPVPLIFARDYVADGHQLMMVGDSLGDVRCGKASEAITVWCNWGYWRNRENEAMFSVEAPLELIDIVNANHVLMK